MGLRGQSGSLSEVLDRYEWPAGDASSFDPCDISLTEVAHIPEPDPHGYSLTNGIICGSPAPPPCHPQVLGEIIGICIMGLDRAVVNRGVDIRVQDDHAVVQRIGNQRVRRVEPHGLCVQQPHEELSRPVVLQPRRCIHDVGERHRMRLGKPERGKPLELLPQLVCRCALDSLRCHALVDLVPELRHLLIRPLVRHGLSQPIGLTRRETCAHSCDLHQLLLEDRHSECLAQNRFSRRMDVANRFLPVAAT